MADLTEEQQEFIVAKLAAYHKPSEVAEMFEEEFEQLITRQAVNVYNPDTVAGQKIGQKWKDLFTVYRNAFLNDRSSIAIAQQNYRLRKMDELLIANEGKSVKMTLKIMEQAAKETGGMFTNKREISGPGGKPIEVTTEAREQAAKELDEWRKAQAANLPNMLSEPPP